MQKNRQTPEKGAVAIDIQKGGNEKAANERGRDAQQTSENQDVGRYILENGVAATKVNWKVGRKSVYKSQKKEAPKEFRLEHVHPTTSYFVTTIRFYLYQNSHALLMHARVDISPCLGMRSSTSIKSNTPCLWFPFMVLAAAPGPPNVEVEYYLAVKQRGQLLLLDPFGKSVGLAVLTRAMLPLRSD